MGTATINPNGTIQNNGTATGAATAHQALADASDATYNVTDTVINYNYLKLDWETFSIPAGAVIKSMAFTARMESVSSASLAEQLFTIRDSADNTLGMQFDQASISGTVITNYTSSALTPTTPVTQAILDGLRVWVKAVVARAVRIYKLSILVTYAELPSTAVSTPTGTITTTTRPLVSWTHTPGTDGGGQYGAQIMIFPASAYAAPGFDPSTYPGAVYDSGIIRDGSTSITPTVDLTTGTTYRAYVRTSQLTAGADQWAAWSFSQFLQSTTPPAAPTLTVTPHPVEGYVHIHIIGGLGVDQYLLQRSQDDGRTWTDVWGMPWTTAAPNIDVYDYEAPMSTDAAITLFLYRAAIVDSAIVSAYTYSLRTQVELPSTVVPCEQNRVWLKDLDTPANSMLVKILEGSFRQSVRPVSRGVFPVLGRRAPVTILDVRHYASTVVTVLTETDADAARFVTLIEGADVLFIQDPLTDEWYWSIGDVTENRLVSDLTQLARSWVVPLTRVDRPTPPINA